MKTTEHTEHRDTNVWTSMLFGKKSYNKSFKKFKLFVLYTALFMLIFTFNNNIFSRSLNSFTIFRKIRFFLEIAFLMI